MSYDLNDPGYQQWYQQWQDYYQGQQQGQQRQQQLQQHALEMAVVEQERYVRRRASRPRHLAFAYFLIATIFIGPFIVVGALMIAMAIGWWAVMVAFVVIILAVVAIVSVGLCHASERWRDR